uniref:(northern house mosquito) hypothetical protein n=1 Tax=Culex pipiens TaxID=7175 RepID=A0A8D8G0M2_CULPI
MCSRYGTRNDSDGRFFVVDQRKRCWTVCLQRFTNWNRSRGECFRDRVEMRASRKGAVSEQVCARVRTASGPFCSLSQLWTILEQVFSIPTLSLIRIIFC